MMSIPGIREPERKSAVAGDHVEAIETELEKAERETREKEKERERRVAWLASAGGKLGLKAAGGVGVGLGGAKEGSGGVEGTKDVGAGETEEKFESVVESREKSVETSSENVGDADEAGWGIESGGKAW